MGLGKLFKSFMDSGKVDIASRYEILREAVSGTMSNFNMARDRKTGQIVGLKVLDKAKTDALEARFKGLKKPTEGEIASSFKHPRIVETLYHGMTTNDEQFVVMEFLDGPGLNSLLISRSKLLDGNRLALARPRSRLHPPRYLPAQLRLLEGCHVAQAHRLRPHAAGPERIHAPRQPYRHPQLHGP